jgi:TolB-like protein
MPKSVFSPVSRYVAVCAAALSTAALPALRAQSGSSSVKAPVSASVSAPVKVAMLDLAFYGKRANDIFPGDTAMADTATAVMRKALAAAPGIEFVDAATVAKATDSPAAKAIVQDRPCNVVVACARSVGQQLGAKWVVMGKISKTSDLIWIFSGELIDVASGKLVLDDSYELKGIAKDMVPKGAEVFARRVAKKVTSDSAVVQ